MEPENMQLEGGEKNPGMDQGQDKRDYRVMDFSSISPDREYREDLELEELAGDSFDELDEDSFAFDGGTEDDSDDKSTKQFYKDLESIPWTAEPPDLNTFQFTGAFKVTAPERGWPVDYFRLLVSDEFLDNVVQQTNDYADDLLKNRNVPEASKLRQWHSITRQDLLEFLGATYFMEWSSRPCLSLYWDASPYMMHGVQRYITQEKYLLILRFLSFAPHRPDDSDKMAKVRPLVDWFNKQMSRVYSPGQNLLIQKWLFIHKQKLLLRGERHFKRLCEDLYGIKIHYLTDSKGFVLKLQPYPGIFDDDSSRGHVQEIVIKLLEDYFDRGHSIYIDGFYTSIPVAQMLTRRNTHCTGQMMRRRRKQLPKDLVERKLTADQMDCRYGNKMVVGKWKGIADVLFLSTEHIGCMEETVSSTNCKKTRPKPLVELRKHFKVEDVLENLWDCYPRHQGAYRWHKKLSRFIFDILLYNSYVMFKANTNRNGLEYADFRYAVFKKLLPIIPSDVDQEPHLPTECRLDNQGRRRAKKCKWCKTLGVQKEVMWYCKECDDRPGLCFEPCFKEFHEMMALG